MLGKLVKYDVKFIIEKMLLYWLSFLLISLLAKILFQYSAYTSFRTLKSLVNLTFYGVFFFLFPFTFIVFGMRYSKNFLKNEGYLMHALPLSKWELVLSKTIAGVWIILLDILVIIFCFFLKDSTVSTLFFQINELLNYVGQNNLNMSSKSCVFFCFLAIIILSIWVIVAIQLSMTLGACSHKHKRMITFIMILCCYILINFTILILFSLFYKCLNSFQNIIVLMNTFLAIFTVIVLIYSLVAYELTVLSLKHELNLG